jgi:hypothetical protein
MIRWRSVRSTVIKPLDWTQATAPAEPDSYRAVWFKLTYQSQVASKWMDPFSESVNLVLPV